MLSSGTFNFDPELDPRKTKKKKINNDKSSYCLSFHVYYAILTGESKERGMSPLPHIFFRSEHNPAVLTQDSHNLPQELLRKESRNESYARFGQQLCSHIVH